MKKIGEILVNMGIITDRQLKEAVIESKKNGEMLGKVLINMGYLAEDQLLKALSKQLDIPYVSSLKGLEISEQVIKAVPVKIVWHYKFMPLSINGEVLKLAISNPHEIWSAEDIKLLLGYNTEIVLVPTKEIMEAIRKYYGIGAETVQKILEKKEPGKKTEQDKDKDTKDIENSSGEASVIKLVDQIFLSAIKSDATDIHFENYRNSVKIRCRVDGILCDMALPQDIKLLYPAIVSRVKIISGLDVVEKRIPQDGRVKIKFQENSIDLRVSVIPVQNGENIVIRILPNELTLNTADLGFYEKDFETLKRLIHLPTGVIFLAGPTGSGKSTTLYACLSEIRSPDTKIITVEDPIEYEMDDIMQIQIQPKVGLTFASSLRSILRHDPDIIMVGEVRDKETADLAIRSALTGHLIFSTLHTNDASSGISRLIDMGIEPFLLVSSVKAFIAQRLVRVNCSKCSKKQNVSGFSAIHNIPVKTYLKGEGCDACGNTGYKGRTAIHELFVLEKELQEMVLKKASNAELKQKAREMGMRTLRENGWEKVKEGVTTIEEVLRVTDADDE